MLSCFRQRRIRLQRKVVEDWRVSSYSLSGVTRDTGYRATSYPPRRYADKLSLLLRFLHLSPNPCLKGRVRRGETAVRIFSSRDKMEKVFWNDGKASRSRGILKYPRERATQPANKRLLRLYRKNACRTIPTPSPFRLSAAVRHGERRLS